MKIALDKSFVELTRTSARTKPVILFEDVEKNFKKFNIKNYRILFRSLTNSVNGRLPEFEITELGLVNGVIDPEAIPKFEGRAARPGSVHEYALWNAPGGYDFKNNPTVKEGTFRKYPFVNSVIFSVLLKQSKITLENTFEYGGTFINNAFFGMSIGTARSNFKILAYASNQKLWQDTPTAAFPFAVEKNLINKCTPDFQYADIVNVASRYNREIRKYNYMNDKKIFTYTDLYPQIYVYQLFIVIASNGAYGLIKHENIMKKRYIDIDFNRLTILDAGDGSDDGNCSVVIDFQAQRSSTQIPDTPIYKTFDTYYKKNGADESNIRSGDVIDISNPVAATMVDRDSDDPDDARAGYFYFPPIRYDKATSSQFGDDVFYMACYGIDYDLVALDEYASIESSTYSDLFTGSDYFEDYGRGDKYLKRLYFPHRKIELRRGKQIEDFLINTTLEARNIFTPRFGSNAGTFKFDVDITMRVYYR